VARISVPLGSNHDGRFDGNVDQAEKEAVLALIEKWKKTFP
jgi:hypothetical protein